MIVVSDTLPVSNLILIGRLELLRTLFNELLVPPAVHNEVLALKSLGKDVSLYDSASWIHVIFPRTRFS